VRIDVSRPDVRGEVDLDVDALAQRAVEKVGHAGYQFRTVDPLRQKRFRARERQQPAGEGGGAGRAFHCVIEVIEDFAFRAVESPASEIDPTDHDGEHVVEVVGDAAGELADRFHLLDLAKLGFGCLALFGFRLQRLVGFDQLLSPLGDCFLEALRSLRLSFRQLLGVGELADGLN
jgi:hypothetical protein